MGRKFAENVKVFDKVDDTNSFSPLNDPPVFGVIYLVKYFHICCKFPSRVNSILSKNTGCDRGNTNYEFLLWIGYESRIMAMTGA